MTEQLRIGLAQINPLVGDVAGNTACILRAIDSARDQGAALLLLPELAVCGYPPEDLLFHAGLTGQVVLVPVAGMLLSTGSQSASSSARSGVLQML